jgi:nucleoside 2-deoxyribosyltransferase
MTKVYLAGPMDFVSENHQKSWRDFSKTFLHEIAFFDPTRRPHDDTMTNEEIFVADLKDIETCDLVLAEVNETGIPIFGTTCEIFYAAYILKKPVYGWYRGQRKVGRRVFQSVLLEREFNTLEKALVYIGENY